MLSNIEFKALLSAAVFAFGLATSRMSFAGCGSDADCKGDRICVEGNCVDPQSSEPPVVVPAPAPMAAPALSVLGGGVHVTSDLPGDIFIDGNGVGRTPATIDGVEPGSHELRVDFDEGGNRKLRVLIREGRVTEMHVEPSFARIVGNRRSGLHVGLAAGGGALVNTQRGNFGFGMAGFVLNVGIVPAVDFRTGARAYLGSTTRFGQNDRYYDGAGFGLEVPAEVRFNLGSVYSIMVGVAAGTGVYPRRDGDDGYCYAEACPPPEESTDIPFTFGPSVSLLSFRFGEARQFEVNGTNWMRVNLEVGVALGGSLEFVWLML